MPRVARIVIPDCPHHVTQRGNNRQDVFFVDDDRVRYLEILGEQAERFGVTVEGYCLMTNHVHLIATPHAADSLAKAVGRTHWLYTQYVNRLHGRSGHLWQNRFYSCALDDEHFWSAMVYVERNPVRARLVRRAWRYRWSSAAAHCEQETATGSVPPPADPPFLLDLAAWARRLPPGGTWRDSLLSPSDEALAEKLRLWTHRGRPLGSESFVSKLERLVGRRLRPLPVGRPRKKDPVNGKSKVKGKQ